MTPEHLIFGQVPPEEQSSRRRRAAGEKAAKTRRDREQAGNRFPDSPEASIEDALRESFRAREEGRRTERKRKEEHFGPRAWEISPSSAARCLRWEAYNALNFPQRELDIETILALDSGSALHFQFLRSLGTKLASGMTELSFKLPEGLGGRIDLLTQDPKTHDWQVIDLKTVTSYSFGKIGRESLPEVYRNDIHLYWPKPEDRRQVLLYMLAAERMNYRVNVGFVWYYDVNSKKNKMAIVPWDPERKYEAGEILRECEQAGKTINDLLAKQRRGEKINEQELPEPKPASRKTCGTCPYNLGCEHGKPELAKRVRREGRRIPPYIRVQQREHERMVGEQMNRLGLFQPALPGFERNKGGRQESDIKKAEKKEPPVCGDCGQPMVWDKKAARGGRFVCEHCSGD